MGGVYFRNVTEVKTECSDAEQAMFSVPEKGTLVKLVHICNQCLSPLML